MYTCISLAFYIINVIVHMQMRKHFLNTTYKNLMDVKFPFTELLSSFSVQIEKSFSNLPCLKVSNIHYDKKRITEQEEFLKKLN